MSTENEPTATGTQTNTAESVGSSAWLGRVAWTAYAGAVGGVAYNGDKLPTWEEMEADPNKTKLVAAWKEAARAVALVVDCRRIKEIVAAGFSGVDRTGRIVDRRIEPTATPMQQNSLLGIPTPKRPSEAHERDDEAKPSNPTEL